MSIDASEVRDESAVQAVGATASEDRDRKALITLFVETNPEYYAHNFEKIGAKTGFTWTFNFAAAFLGPVWFGMRNLWKWGLPFVMLEVFAYIQIARGWFGNLGAESLARVEQIEGTLAFRKQQLASAIEKPVSYTHLTLPTNREV